MRPGRRPRAGRGSAVAALAVLVPLLPLAGPRAEGFVAERAFPVAGACYLRRDDPARRARHPGRTVTEIRLWGDARTLVGTRPQAGRIDPELDLTIRFDFADGGHAQGVVGCPERKGRIRRCGRTADCAGDLAVEHLPDGRLRLVNDGTAPRVQGAPGGFSPDAVCPAAADAARPGRFVPPDDGNRVFLLERRPLADCTGRR